MGLERMPAENAGGSQHNDAQVHGCEAARVGTVAYSAPPAGLPRFVSGFHIDPVFESAVIYKTSGI